jgi:hypothetical protein
LPALKCVNRPSQNFGSDDRLPKQHTKTRNHKNPQDKAPRVAIEGLVVVGGQPAGIAHAKLLGRQPSEPTSPEIDKDFLKPVLELQMLVDAGGRLRPAPGARFVAAEPNWSRRRLCRCCFKLMAGPPIDLRGT